MQPTGNVRTGIYALMAAVVGLTPMRAHAGDIDTEHIFGFMIGSDVGQPGEREFQSQTTARFGKAGGRYRAGGQEFELEFVPADNIRLELGSTVSAYDIAGMPGIANRQTLAWQGASIDFRYRLLDRESSAVGMTLALEGDIGRIDDTFAAPARTFDTGVILAFDREIIPGVAVAALNLIYQPGWTHYFPSGDVDREADVGVALGAVAEVRPNILLGGEARYLRRYDGIGLGAFTGEALFVGPTAYIQLSDRSRLTASWSAQVWGRTVEPAAASLDLVNFERHQARLIYGINF